MHRVDARAKLLAVLVVILACVVIARGTSGFQGRLLAIGVLEAYLLALALLAELDMRAFFSRVALALPFGGSIALLKPFIEPGTPLLVFYGMEVSREGTESGALLLSVVVVSVSAMVLLSSTTRMHELASALRSLRLPGSFLTLTFMTVRFLPLYMRSLEEILTAQRSRGFSIRRAPRTHVLHTLASTAATLFLRACIHGREVYLWMLSRGYEPWGAQSVPGGKLRAADLGFAATAMAVAGSALVVALHPQLLAQLLKLL